MKKLIAIRKDIKLIKELLLSERKSSLIINGWINKKTLMHFFDYGDTQMLSLEKEHSITVSKIGRRKFYSIESIIMLIEKNIQK